MTLLADISAGIELLPIPREYMIRNVNIDMNDMMGTSLSVLFRPEDIAGVRDLYAQIFRILEQYTLGFAGIDFVELAALPPNEDVTLFPCVSGDWMYYTVKSARKAACGAFRWTAECLRRWRRDP